MAQDQTIKQFSNFSKGLLTEATPLDFPEQYSLDEANMLLRLDGSRERRDGIEFETGGAQTVTATTTAKVGMSFYRWEFAGNRDNSTVGVVQVGTDLYFLDLTQTIPSASLLNGGSEVSVSSIMKTANAAPKLSFDTINGDLLVASEDFYAPLRLVYDVAGDSITSFTLEIYVRDLWGVEDTVTDVTERPAALTDEHNYNLQNQGWTSTNIAAYFTANTVYPSNAQIMHLGKDGSDVWSAAWLDKQFFGNSPAPKGKFILPFFDRGTGVHPFFASGLDRVAQSGVSTLPDDYEQGTISTLAVNFGRVFYAGIETNVSDGDQNSPNGSSLILYTQIVERTDQLKYCYQEADPTAEKIFDLVDSDGGFIQIPELGKVVKMLAFDASVIIFANNGVWSIDSVDGRFTPTSYQVNKITPVGCESPDSIIEVEGSILFWSESGIYQLQREQVSSRAVAVDVTLKTIKTLYNDITDSAKDNAKGYYDAITKQVGWLYQSDPDWDFDNFPDFCDKELIYDLQLQAFTVNTISSKTVQSPYICGAVLGENLNTNTVIESVEVNADPVTVNGEVVEQTTTGTIQTTSKLKFLTYVPSSGFAAFTLSQYSNEDFLDWDTEDYVSFIETGYISFQDWSRKKGIPYLICHFKRTEDGFDGSLNPTNESSCLVQARWEWSNNSVSKRWGRQFQAYRYRTPYVPVDVNDRFETGELIITTRNKIRGHGKAVSFRFESETSKNMHLYGFSMSARGNTNV